MQRLTMIHVSSFTRRSSVLVRPWEGAGCSRASCSALVRASFSFQASTVKVTSLVSVMRTVAVKRFGRGFGFGDGGLGLVDRPRPDVLLRGAERSAWRSVSYLMPMT